MPSQKNSYQNCYIGINVPANVHNEYETLNRIIKSDIKKYHIVPVKTSHITLYFLGDKTFSELEQVNEEVTNLIKAGKLSPTFHFRTGDFGYFDLHRHTVLYLEIIPTKELFDVNKVLAKTLKKYSKPQNKFLPHLTLGRIYSREDKKIFIDNFEKIKKEIEKNKIKFATKELVLNGRELENKEIVTVYTYS